MKKRILAILLCLFMLGLLCACTAEDGEPSSSAPGESTIAASSEVSEEISIEESSILEETSLPEVSQPDESEPEISEPEVSEPEVSEPEASDPPTLELPPEEELSMELALRFDMGPGHPTSLYAYSDGYPEYGALRMEQHIGTDGEGNFYAEIYNGVVRINDGVEFIGRKIQHPWVYSQSFSPATIWLENSSLWETILTLHGENKEVLSRIKISAETPYQFEPCEIHYTTNEYGGEYATVRYYKPRTVRVNEATFENVVDYQYFDGDDGTLYLALFYADYGEIYAITGGITHQELIPVTEENKTHKKPTLVTLYDFEGEELGELLDDPAGYTFKRGRDISIYDLHCSSSHEYWHIHLRDSLKELAGDRTAMEAYLKEQGYDVKVSRIVALDVKYAPFTLMALTESGEAYFVTVRDLRGSEEQFYKVYSVEEFRASYLSREVKLYLFGDEYEWETTYPVTIENETAMIPVVSALQALGGNVEWQNGSAKITMAGKQCFVHPGDLCIAYGDEEWIYTERYIVDSKGDELLMRSIELQSFFDVFCPTLRIRVDIAKDAVYLEQVYRNAIECYFSPDRKSVLYAVENLETEDFDWYRIVDGGAPELMPEEGQPYWDIGYDLKMLRWTDNFSQVFFTIFDYDGVGTSLFEWNADGEVNRISTKCHQDSLSKIYADGSIYFREIVSWNDLANVVENDLGEHGEAYMELTAGRACRWSSLYYYDGNEKIPVAENEWLEITEDRPYAANSPGGIGISLDPNKKIKLSELLERIEEPEYRWWLEEALPAYTDCTFFVKGKAYSVDLGHVADAIVDDTAKHLAVLADWDPKTSRGKLYLLEIGEQGAGEARLISEDVPFGDPRKQYFYFEDNCLCYRAGGEDHMYDLGE